MFKSELILIKPPTPPPRHLNKKVYVKNMDVIKINKYYFKIFFNIVWRHMRKIKNALYKVRTRQSSTELAE
jgi:hypothetical protein